MKEHVRKGHSEICRFSKQFWFYDFQFMAVSAARYNQPDLLKLAIQWGADIHAPRLLAAAFDSGNVETTLMALDGGAYNQDDLYLHPKNVYFVQLLHHYSPFINETDGLPVSTLEYVSIGVLARSEAIYDWAQQAGLITPEDKKIILNHMLHLVCNDTDRDLVDRIRLAYRAKNMGADIYTLLNYHVPLCPTGRREHEIRQLAIDWEIDPC
jgi:hypothetical protein